jgi:predicted regulator of Ras-like GTPase activity (Roadblock/LC7/MglB family)
VENLLRQLNTVPGVFGCMVCDSEGRLLAHAFPPMIDAATLERAAGEVGERTAALESMRGPGTVMDLRYTGSRIVVRSAGGARLLCLCSPSVNLQLLSMSAAGVLRQIEEQGPAAAAADGAPAEDGPSALHEAVQAVEALIERRGGDPVRLRGQIALRAGFALDFVDASTPDDPDKLERLRQAARAVLGEDI